MTAVKTWSIVSGLDESYSEASVACETRCSVPAVAPLLTLGNENNKRGAEAGCNVVVNSVSLATGRAQHSAHVVADNAPSLPQPGASGDHQAAAKG